MGKIRELREGEAKALRERKRGTSPRCYVVKASALTRGIWANRERRESKFSSWSSRDLVGDTARSAAAVRQAIISLRQAVAQLRRALADYRAARQHRESLRAGGRLQTFEQWQAAQESARASAQNPAE